MFTPTRFARMLACQRRRSRHRTCRASHPPKPHLPPPPEPQ